MLVISLNHLSADQVWPPQDIAQSPSGRETPSQARRVGHRQMKAIGYVPRNPCPSAQGTSKRTSNQTDTLCHVTVLPRATSWVRRSRRRELTQSQERCSPIAEQILLPRCMPETEHRKPPAMS